MANNSIVERIAKRIKISKADANDMLQAYVKFLIEETEKGNQVTIKGLGSFELAEKAERRIYNPTNKKYTVVPKKTTLKFKPSNSFKNTFK